MPKCEIFDPFFYINNPIWVGYLRTGEFFYFLRRLREIFAILCFLRRLSLGRLLVDWRIFLFFAKTTGNIRHFVFFAQAEPRLKNCLRRLSLR